MKNPCIEIFAKIDRIERLRTSFWILNQRAKNSHLIIFTKFKRFSVYSTIFAHHVENLFLISDLKTSCIGIFTKTDWILYFISWKPESRVEIVDPKNSHIIIFENDFENLRHHLLPLWILNSKSASQKKSLIIIFTKF